MTFPDCNDSWIHRARAVRTFFLQGSKIHMLGETTVMIINKQERGDLMRKRIMYLLVAVFLMAYPARGFAGINLPVMWSQLPDMDKEANYLSTYGCETGEPSGPIVAIDFMVATNPELYKPIGAIRWWGSYLDEFVPETPLENVEFKISWYFDKIGKPWTPGEHLYHECSVFATEEYYGMAGARRVYEYNAHLSIPFDQEYWQSEQPYGWWWFWVGIAFNDDYEPGRQWGWHASLPTVDIVANWGETQTGPWTYLDNDVALELMVIPTFIDKLRPRSCLPNERIRIIGAGFGDTQGDSLVHIGNKNTYDSTSSRIKLWTDTKIKVKIPFANKKCSWFTGGDGEYRKKKVWVTVGGVDSNKKNLKVLKPDNCP